MRPRVQPVPPPSSRLLRIPGLSHACSRPHWGKEDGLPGRGGGGGGDVGSPFSRPSPAFRAPVTGTPHTTVCHTPTNGLSHPHKWSVTPPQNVCHTPTQLFVTPPAQPPPPPSSPFSCRHNCIPTTTPPRSILLQAARVDNSAASAESVPRGRPILELPGALPDQVSRPPHHLRFPQCQELQRAEPGQQPAAVPSHPRMRPAGLPSLHIRWEWSAAYCRPFT